jgi:hypothetical protein
MHTGANKYRDSLSLKTSRERSDPEKYKKMGG